MGFSRDFLQKVQFCVSSRPSGTIQKEEPVFACFLDLSRASDLFSYDVILWKKLEAIGKFVYRAYKYLQALVWIPGGLFMSQK